MLLFICEDSYLWNQMSTTLQAWLAIWYCSYRTSILIGAFTVGICDSITIFIWGQQICMATALLSTIIELSFGLVFYILFSLRINDNSYQLIFFFSCLFSPLYVGNANSLLAFKSSLTYILQGWLWILKYQWRFISNI